tara:strand:+ start:259 stop:1317 length:1059 start_codon:yes stop_codon:yes gene_type:complete
MPHGGYHGTIKMGGRVIQDSSGRPVSSGGSKKKKKIKEVTGGDARGNYLANQAFRQQQADDRAMQAAMTNRASIKSMAGKGFINPADFKGGAARLPGESGEDYRKFMVGLRSLNTGAFDKAFPFSSGAAIRNVSKFMPGMGVVSLMQKAFGKGKDMAGGALNKVAGSGIMQNLFDDSKGAGSGFLGNLSTMFKDLTGIGKGKGATTEVKPQNFSTPKDPQIDYVDPIMNMVAPIQEDIFMEKGIDPSLAMRPDMETSIKSRESADEKQAQLNLINRIFGVNFTNEPSFMSQLYDRASTLRDLNLPPEVAKAVQFNKDGTIMIPTMEEQMNFADGGSVGNFNLLKDTNDEMHG